MKRMNCKKFVQVAKKRLEKRQHPESAGQGLTERANLIDKYANSPVIEKDLDPMKCWKDSRLLYPIISKVARKYLSCPVSSVYCEGLFSEADTIYDEKKYTLAISNSRTTYFSPPQYFPLPPLRCWQVNIQPMN